MSLRNHLPCHRPRHVCADPIQELPYRRLPSHNANSDVRSLNPVSQLNVPDSPAAYSMGSHFSKAASLG